MSTVEEQIKKISARILEIKSQKEELEEAEKNLRSTLSELVDNGQTLVGDFKINRRNNVRFDDALARKNLTPHEYEQIAVLKADSKRAAALLEADRLQLCQKDYGAVVSVSLRND